MDGLRFKELRGISDERWNLLVEAMEYWDRQFHSDVGRMRELMSEACGTGEVMGSSVPELDTSETEGVRQLRKNMRDYGRRMARVGKDRDRNNNRNRPR